MLSITMRTRKLLKPTAFAAKRPSKLKIHEPFGHGAVFLPRAENAPTVVERFSEWDAPLYTVAKPVRQPCRWLAIPERNSRRIRLTSTLLRLMQNSPNS